MRRPKGVQYYQGPLLDAIIQRITHVYTYIYIYIYIYTYVSPTGSAARPGTTAWCYRKKYYACIYLYIRIVHRECSTTKDHCMMLSYNVLRMYIYIYIYTYASSTGSAAQPRATAWCYHIKYYACIYICIHMRRPQGVQYDQGPLHDTNV